jgi:hypothetical protein
MPTIRASRNAVVSTCRAPAPGTGAVECSAARECWNRPGSHAAEIAMAFTLIEAEGRRRRPANSRTSSRWSEPERRLEDDVLVERPTEQQALTLSPMTCVALGP